MKKHILWLLALVWSVTAVGETITVARALQIGSTLAVGASTTQSYTIEGCVNEITNNSFNASFNNMTFWIADTQGSLSSNAEGALYVYRGRPTVELQKGDRIRITDYLKNFNGTIETANTNAPVTLLERPSDREITYGSLRVCAQNLENFYIHPNAGRANYSTDEIAAKTQKIVSMMLTVDADIYAFCEVEAKPEVLDYLVSVANSYVSGDPYVAVSDGIDVDWDATYNNNIKSGFIYRSDRVQPIGSNVAASTANYYRNTMRYQAFSQLSNGEKLVVCMNHFKAKDSSEDQGESVRMGNAYSLMNALSYVTTDPDILILGDLNCEYGEAPITYITNAGYAEQLLRFNDSSIYSHCYNGGELIDHALANTSMANQIVDAYVRHLSTTCSAGVTEETSYSDHDPYVVEINLSSGATPAPTMTCAAAAEAALSVSANNELYNNGETFSIRGFVTSIATAYNPTYGNISFWMADTQNGGNVLQAYRCGVDATSIPNVNDYVEVTGQLTKYNATPEFAAGCTCQIIYNSGSAINLGPKTIAEFLQLKNTKDTCVLTGVVRNIENTVYGNFHLEDATGSLYIYGLLTPEGVAQKFDSLGIAEGDILTLKATYLEYNQSPQAKNAIYVSHSKQATFWGPVTVKLDPSSTTMYSWNQVGIWAWVTNGTKSTNLFEQWPGVPVTIDPETGWWSYTFNNIPSGQLNIIWNDYGYYGYLTDDIENVAENTCYRLPSYSYSHEVVDCPTTHDTMTVAEAVALSYQQPVNEASSYDVSVVGYVVSTQNYEQTYGNQSFLIADDMSGTVTMKAYLATPEKNGVPYPVQTGDKVRITGPIEHYVNNNTGEDFAELLRPSVTFINEAAGDRSLPAIPEISVADALQYGYSMEVGYRTNTTYDIVGYVTNIEEDAMDTYGNMTFWIADEANGASSNAGGGLYIFRGIPDRRLQTGDMVRVRSYIRHTAVTESSSIVQTASSAGVMYLGHPAANVPTTEDLMMAGYNIINNIVLCFHFGDEPCNDVVITGSYNGWTTGLSECVRMSPLAGFDGWYAAQIPYNTNGGTWDNQAKPVQLSDIGAFNWDNQAGDVNAWIYRGGNEAYIVSGYDNEVNVYYESPGAYIYEIAYWKNNNNPCTSQTTTYTVLLEAPQNAPDSIEIIGSFDNWTGTLMTYDAQTGYWTATITATPSDVFKFRQAGTWDNEILVYDSKYDDWTTLPSLVISQYLYDNIVYLNFDNAELYRWTKQDDESVYYIPYNLQAVSEPGKVVFTWDAEMISDSYALHLYDVNDNDRYLGYLPVQGVTTLTYMVEDFLDGKEIRWSLEPQSPSLLDAVFAPNTFVMQKSQVELSNFNLLTADGITLDLTWQSNVPVQQYLVTVLLDGSILREETVTSAEFHYTSPIPGTMEVYVEPLNAAGEAVGRHTYAGSIELSAVPDPFKNLQAVANGHDITSTWEGAADSVYLQIYHMVDGEFTDIIYQSVVAGHSFTYTVEEDGNYAVQLRAWTELSPGQYGGAPYVQYVVVQVFTVPTYAIQIDASEGGYIFPSGLSGNYPVGYTLNAYAYPYEGYRFVGWSDGVTEAERTINVQGAMSITALFEALAVYTVAVQASEGGWIYVRGDMSSYDVSYMGQWYEDSQMTIYASAAQGYSFYQWSDGVTNAQRTVTVNSNINLTAIFMPDRHLTLAVNDIVMGGISVAGDYSYADGVYTTVHGASLTLTAQPNQGYRFVNWSDGVQTVQRVVTMTDDMALTAIFELIITPVVQYSITVSAGTGGMVNDASGIYNAGDLIELTATPMEGYEFVQWSDGVSTNPRMLIVTENKSLTAIFRIRTIRISVTAGPGGTVNGTISGLYNYGTSVSFSAAPAEHYRFTGWSDGNTDIERYITLVKDTVITASFVAIPLYTLNLTAGQGGQIRVNNEPYTTTFNRAYEENTSVVIEAAANANYIFSRWSDGNTNAIRVVPMNSDLSLTAEFLPIYTLTIVANNGSVLVQGDAEATAKNVYKAVAGTVLTLTAQPNQGYRFVSWSDGVQTISRDITLTSTTFLVATFEVASTTPQYTVTVGITGTGTGTVNGQTSISTLYYENDQVPLTALAGESSEFVGWSDGVTTASRTLVVSSDTLVIAIFNFVEPTVQYTVTFKNYDGTILESKKWNEGETPTCSVTPTHPDDEANTYSFIGWTPEIVPVTADAVYTAVFEAKPVVLPSFTVTFYDWDDTVLSQQSVTQGENATPPETPTRAGYVFTGWDGNYTNVQHNEAVFATYKPAEEEALENVLDGNNAVKILREGLIFILRGDKTYTLDGQIVR